MKNIAKKELNKKLIQIIKETSSPALPVKPGLKPVLKKLSNIKSIIFDIYGTLFISDSGDINTSSSCLKKISMNKVFEYAGFSIIDLYAGEEGERLFKNTILSKHTELKKKGNLFPEVNVFEIWQKVLTSLIHGKKLRGDITRENISVLALKYEIEKNPVWPMPNLQEILNFLIKEKILIGIISNAQFYTPLMFEAFFNENIYVFGFNKEITILSYEQKIAKPSLLLFQKVSEKLSNKFSAKPEEVLYIGNDMYNDILPAAEIGFKTALFAGDLRSLRLREDIEECKKLSPDLIITDLIQIKDIFDNQINRLNSL